MIFTVSLQVGIPFIKNIDCSRMNVNMIIYEDIRVLCANFSFQLVLTNKPKHAGNVVLDRPLYLIGELRSRV